MGLISDVAGAAIGAAFPGAGAATAAGGRGKKRASSGDSSGDQGYGPPDPSDSTSSDAGSDDQKRPGYMSRFGANLSKRMGSKTRGY